MFNIFTIAFFGICAGLGLAMFITRQKTPFPLQLVPPEDDLLRDPKNAKELQFDDLFRVGERLCQENGLTITEKTTVSEEEIYWIAESNNAFFFGNYVLGFFKPKVQPGFVSLPTILEFKDFVKSAGGAKGLFLTTSYFTKDVLQPLEGPKVNLYNRLKILDEMKRLQLA